MSAYGCCGEYNEHAPDCVTVENANLKNKLVRAEAVILEMEGVIVRQMDSDDFCDRPFNEDAADALRSLKAYRENSK